MFANCSLMVVPLGSRISWEITRRQKFCEEAASWPTGLSGDVVEYVAAMAAVATPTKDWSWVAHATDVRLDVTGAAQGFNNATNVENAPGSDALIGRRWIREIP